MPFWGGAWLNPLRAPQQLPRSLTCRILGGTREMVRGESGDLVSSYFGDLVPFQGIYRGSLQGDL